MTGKLNLTPEQLAELTRRSKSDPVIRDLLHGEKPVITRPVGSRLMEKLERLALQGSTEGEREAARRAIKRIEGSDGK